MIKTTIIAALLAVLTTAAQAQHRTFYDTSGRVVGRASTDSAGSTTLYDATGRVSGRESRSGNSTTLHDSSGRVVGRSTTPSR